MPSYVAVWRLEQVMSGVAACGDRPAIVRAMYLARCTPHFRECTQTDRGATLTETPVDQAEISGDLLSVLRELDVRTKTSITTHMTRVSALREQLLPDYPEIALRELLLNAIMHRDYESNTPVRFSWFSDRIEIQNPGGLYGEVTLDSLTRRSSYRNRFGYGIQRAQKALRDNAQPEARFAGDHNALDVTILRKSI